MARPVIGILGNAHLINEQYAVQAAGEMNLAAVAEICDAVPVILPADPAMMSVEDALATCQGFIFPGARANVHPEEYGQSATEAHGTFDRRRDALALGIIRASVARGVPVLGLCRGFQELAVAFGATLHPEIRELPGRMNHRMPPDGTVEEKFERRHWVQVSEGGPFHHIFGSTSVFTNTLHGQGIDIPGDRVIVDGTAEDGTPECIYIKDAPGFALGVQWHPEYLAGQDPVSRPLFEAFAEVVHTSSRKAFAAE